MRIACGGIQHETNTFATTPTTLADFQRDSGCGPDFSEGAAIFKLYRGTGTIHGGYIDAAEANSPKAGQTAHPVAPFEWPDIELLPLLCARAQPSGVVRQEAFDALLSRFLERLQSQLPVDGVVLDMHGAMVTEQYDDAEGAFVAAVREMVGPDVPLFMTLDLHANISPRMAELADVIIGFDTYPHVDMRERGREAVKLLAQTIRGDVHPVQEYRQLPLMTMPPMQCTLREPMQSFMQGVLELERRPGVLTVTVSMGFPFADIADAGGSILVTADGDRTLAQQTADELAARLWELRDALQPQLTTIDEAIRFANEDADSLVIFADGSDNPGGGAPCDGTVALRALIEAGFQGATVGVLCDPETVEQAHAAGVGHEIDARIGGKTDDRHGAPVEVRASVRTLSDGRFLHRGPMRRGLPGEFGRMAVLTVGGVEIVVAANRMQLLDAEMLRIVGITPEARRLLVVKSAVHFRADLGRLAAHIFDADTPGIHRPDFSRFQYRQVRRPIHPLDSDVSYP